MSKYGHRPHNWFEAIVNKLGGEERAEAFLRGDILIQPVSHPILCPISDGASLFFHACDESETIADARDVFKSGIDSDFKNWGLSKKPSKATRKTPAEAYKLAENADFKTMFTFLSADLEKLCVTEHQIKVFCKKTRIGFAMMFTKLFF